MKKILSRWYSCISADIVLPAQSFHSSTYVCTKKTVERRQEAAAFGTRTQRKMIFHESLRRIKAIGVLFPIGFIFSSTIPDASAKFRRRGYP